MVSPDEAQRPRLHTARRLLASTVGSCFRYRVTGLAAEAAFFAILSLPPLVFGLAGTVGYITSALGSTTVGQLRDQVVALAGQLLAPEGVSQVIEPTLDDVLAGGRADVISLGFVIALWSGSRALNVFVDTITIMYGLGGHRGIVKTRALSFALYVVALLIGVVVLPLVVAGPQFVRSVLPPGIGWLQQLYWPVVVLLSIAFLTTLYHLSVPGRTSWIRDLPGAALSFVGWIAGSYVLRWVLSAATGGTSVYGPLAAPIAVLVWLYLVSIAVLIGAALNAAVNQMWPVKGGARPTVEPPDVEENPVTPVRSRP
ncbi:MAG TPA: YihY/virulence factor BrkB family protein [Jiangellales bacterium]|nr:YihY/virulence factor BrkB family protein [Jiangellales bacterium]